MNLTDYSFRARGVIGRRTDSSGSSALLKFDRTNRTKSPALLFFTMLSFAVFLWGIQYKLSLYHSEVAQRIVPVAKLLSQKERPSFSTQLERFLLTEHPLPKTPSKKLFTTHIAQEPPTQIAISIRVERAVRLPDCGAARKLHDIDLSSPRAPPIVD